MDTDLAAVATASKFDEWDDFDPIEYVHRNYGPLLPDDRTIIETIVATLRLLPPHSLKRVADVGTGSNFYPAMLLAPLVSPDGCIELIEFSAANRAFISTLLADGDGIFSNTNKLGKRQSVDTREPWQKFNALIAEAGQTEPFQDTFDQARRLAKSVPGSIYDLPMATYDFISSHYTAESITNDKATCIKALNTLVQAVKPGGGFIITLVVGSDAYYAGEATRFPSVNLMPADIREIFNAMPNVTTSVTIAADKHQKFRDDYYGLALVMGTVQA